MLFPNDFGRTCYFIITGIVSLNDIKLISNYSVIHVAIY